MVLEAKASKEAGLVPGGHAIVNTRLRALFDEAGWAGEQIGGVDYLFFLRQLSEAVDKDWPSVLEKLETMRSILVNRSSMLLNVTLDQKTGPASSRACWTLWTLPAPREVPAVAAGARGRLRRPDHPGPGQLCRQGRQPLPTWATNWTARSR